MTISIHSGSRLLATLLISFWLCMPAGADLYATGGGAPELSGLWNVNPLNGQSILVFRFSGVHIYAGGLAYDAVSDKLYATGAEDSSTGTSRLFSIDRTSGAITAFPGMSSSINLSSGGLAIHPVTGVMYATGGYNDGVHAFQSTGLFSIDKITGAATLIGFENNLGAWTGLAVLPNGAVPEPASSALALAALGLLAMGSRRNRKNAAV